MSDTPTLGPARGCLAALGLAFAANAHAVPETTIDSAPPNPSSSASATFTFSGSGGAVSFECSLDSGPFGTCTSPLSTPALIEGLHTFLVRAVDGSAVVDPVPASHSWVVDTTAPPAPIIVTPANGSQTNNPSPVVSGDAEPGSSVTVSMDGTEIGSTTTDMAGGWSLVPAALSSGLHTVTANATDAANNRSITVSATFRVDTGAPDTTISSGPTGSVSSSSATFTFGADEPGSSFECQLDGAAFGPCSNPLLVSGLAETSHTLQVRAVDAAGNVDLSPAGTSWTVDLTAPHTAITGYPTNPSTSLMAGFTFSANEASSFACQLDGAGFATCTSPAVYPGLSEGSHTFQVRATDTAGNIESAPASLTWEVDTTAPQTTLGTTPANPANSSAAAFSFSASEAGSSFECQLDGGSFAPCNSPVNLSGLAEGSHTFRVRATDSASNTDATPASFTWTVDTTAPDTTFTTTPPNPGSGSAAFAFSASEPGSFACRLDGAAFAPCSSPVNLSGLAQGSHTFQVRATDGVGNTDGTPASYTWSVAGAAAVPLLPAFGLPLLLAGLLGLGAGALRHGGRP